MNLSCDSFQSSVLSQNLLTTPFCLSVFMTQLPVSVFPIHLWFSSPLTFPLSPLVLILLSFHHLWLLHINSFSIHALNGPSLVSLPSFGTCQHFLAVASLLQFSACIFTSSFLACVCVWNTLLSPSYEYMAFPGDSTVKNMPVMQQMWVQSLGHEDPLEKEMLAHSSCLTCEIPWTEEPRGL